MRNQRTVILYISLAVMPCSSNAQVLDRPTTTVAPDERDAIPLNTGGMTGMPPENWFVRQGERSVRNVSQATLTPVLPRPGSGNGAAIILAPGGGFHMLAMDNEGWPIAHWLADRGIAVFLLKYRLRPTPAGDEAYAAFMNDFRVNALAGKLDITPPPQSLADAKAAIRLVRGQAAKWRVDPKRVGMLGFSAGASLTLEIALNAPPAEMPAFVATIYGPMKAVTVPKAAPPMYISLAADDQLFRSQGFDLAESWQRAGKPVELHVHQSGGHGYGMGRAGTTSVGWLESFRAWLDANGFLKAIH